MARFFASLLGAFILSFAVAGCGQAALLFDLSFFEEAPDQVPEGMHAVILPSGEELFVELAQTPDERAAGLMFRTELPENHGMWFLFSAERPLSFWMKNTLIPLDVIYMDEGMTIVDIHTMPPCPETARSCPSYPSQSPAQHALELNGGRAEALGLRIGDQLSLDF